MRRALHDGIGDNPCTAACKGCEKERIDIEQRLGREPWRRSVPSAEMDATDTAPNPRKPMKRKLPEWAVDAVLTDDDLNILHDMRAEGGPAT